MAKFNSPARICGSKRLPAPPCPIANDGRADGVDGDEREGGPGAPSLVEEMKLVCRRPALTAELLGSRLRASRPCRSGATTCSRPRRPRRPRQSRRAPRRVEEVGVILDAAQYAASAVRGSLRGSFRRQPRVHSAVLPGQGRDKNCNTFSFVDTCAVGRDARGVGRPQARGIEAGYNLPGSRGIRPSPPGANGGSSSVEVRGGSR